MSSSFFHFLPFLHEQANKLLPSTSPLPVLLSLVSGCLSFQNYSWTCATSALGWVTWWLLFYTPRPSEEGLISLSELTDWQKCCPKLRAVSAFFLVLVPTLFSMPFSGVLRRTWCIPGSRLHLNIPSVCKMVLVGKVVMLNSKPFRFLQVQVTLRLR